MFFSVKTTNNKYQIPFVSHWYNKPCNVSQLLQMLQKLITIRCCQSTVQTPIFLPRSRIRILHLQRMTIHRTLVSIFCNNLIYNTGLVASSFQCKFTKRQVVRVKRKASLTTTLTLLAMWIHATLKH